MPFQGLRTCIYKVPDMDAAKLWYTRLLGFEPYFDQPFYVGFNVGGYELGLQPEETGSTEKGFNVNTYWGVDDVEKVLNQMVSMGASVFEVPTDVGGGITVASALDPWGNIVGIIFNPHFKAS
jgi:predicted enzyme related to lactoylglutathione lyase